MSELTAGPDVPFPMIEQAMCRDCPFPMSEDWPDDVRPSFEKWQNDLLNRLRKHPSSEADASASSPYSELIGKTLEVVRPGGMARMIDDPNRILLTVDEQDRIKEISIGV